MAVGGGQRHYSNSTVVYKYPVAPSAAILVVSLVARGRRPARQPCQQQSHPYPPGRPAAVLASGKRLPCDMLVVASGCKYNLQPPFLRELGGGGWVAASDAQCAHPSRRGACRCCCCQLLKTINCAGGTDSCSRLDAAPAPCPLPVPPAPCPHPPTPAGFNDLHNFAFMGPSPRIGTASDFVFAHVPVGPQQQIDMFLHAVLCCKAGLEAEATAALRPTALANHGNGVEDATLVGGRMAGKYTWFESRPWAKMNFAMEVRLGCGLGWERRWELAGDGVAAAWRWRLACALFFIISPLESRPLPPPLPQDRVASMVRTHSVGRGFLGRIGLRLKVREQQQIQWAGLFPPAWAQHLPGNLP